jgi:hypothetical protein
MPNDQEIASVELPTVRFNLGSIPPYWSHTIYSAPPQSVSFAATFVSDRRAMAARLDVMTLFRMVSEYTGGSVKITPEYKGLPVLPVPGRFPVYLYRLVEVLDEIIDYDEVIDRLPGLTFVQIHGGIRFLRRVAQFNSAGVDIDDVEQQAMSQDPQLIDALRRSLADKEVVRVLNPPE